MVRVRRLRAGVGGSAIGTDARGKVRHRVLAVVRGRLASSAIATRLLELRTGMLVNQEREQYSPRIPEKKANRLSQLFTNKLVLQLSPALEKILYASTDARAQEEG